MHEYVKYYDDPEFISLHELPIFTSYSAKGWNNSVHFQLQDFTESTTRNNYVKIQTAMK